MNIHPIDLKFRALPHCIAAFLVESGGEYALIETGPSSCLDACLAGIRKLGVEPEQIGKVLVTHIHLDHSGAAGWWAAQGAQIYVHPRGARHMANPERLIQGATMIYGNAMDALWGDILPIPEEQITTLADGDTVSVGSETLTAWDTPGHAFHHHAFIAESGEAFVGDAAGMRLPGQKFISPTTAPSQFDPESYVQTIQRLREANFSKIYLTHFGPVEDVDDHLLRYEGLVTGASELIHAHRLNGAPQEEIHDHFTAWNRSRARREGVSSQDWLAYENANPSVMGADGISLYWQRKE